MTILHLGNLPFSVTSSAVRGLLEQHGPTPTVDFVDVREPGAPRSGRPAGDSRR